MAASGGDEPSCSEYGELTSKPCNFDIIVIERLKR